MSAIRQLLVRGASRPCLTSVRPLTTSPSLQDQVTHTGQQFAANDPRNVRFAVSGVEKQVNTQWAQDLIAAVPPKMVQTRVVSCDGGGGALGHPKVFINLDHSGPHSCPYCGLRFQLDPNLHYETSSTEERHKQ